MNYTSESEIKTEPQEEIKFNTLQRACEEQQQKQQLPPKHVSASGRGTTGTISTEHLTSVNDISNVRIAALQVAVLSNIAYFHRRIAAMEEKLAVMDDYLQQEEGAIHDDDEGINNTV